jgi:hypothetical protein
MDFATRNWFGYINENIRLDEGIRNIGLTEMIADFIESALHEAPESAKTWMGHRWKKTHLHQYMPRIQMQRLRFETMEPLLSALDYWTGGTKSDDLPLDEPTPDVQFENILKENIEWSAEKAKRTKFILQNINRTIKDDALGKWPRAFKKAVKALGKLGLKSDVVEFVQEVLQNTEDRAWKAFETRFREVFTFLNMHPDNIRVLAEYENMVAADEKAEEEMAEMEDPDQIVHTFDDGSYWYDLDTTSCDIEGERMGHCGAGQSGGTLFSLRKPEGKRGKSKSFVTLEMGDGEQGETLFQIKGRGNSAPPEATWYHIVWFIDNMNIQAVEEQGEYSDNPEDFLEMNDYLESQTNVNFAGNRQTRVDELENELQNLGYEMDGLDHSEVYFEISDYEGDGGEIYVDATVEAIMQINLGWPMFFQTKGGYIAMDKEGNPLTGLQMIPTNYSEQSSFNSDVGLDTILDELPGEPGDIELEFKMLQGVVPDDYDGEEEYPETAHLIVTMRSSSTIEDEERTGGYSATSECSSFFQTVLDEFDEEDKYKQYVKYVQARLQEEEYIKQNAYVKDMQKLRDLSDLKYWSAYTDADETKLTFIDERNDGQVGNKLPTGLAMPTEAMIYLTAGERQDANSVIRMMFPNVRWSAGTQEIRAPSLNSQMAQRLNDAYGSAQRAKMAATGQEEFEFGPQYEAKPAMELAKDIELVIYPKVRYDVREPDRVPTLSFDFFFQIRVGFDDDVEEIDRLIAMAKHINDNPTIVREAARDIIAVPMSELNDGVQARKHLMLNPNTAVSYYNEMNNRFGARADAGNDDDERRMLIAMWIRDNYAQMDEIEKFVAYYKYIEPMLGRAGAVFRIFGANAAINPETGEPRAWWDLVQNERQRRGVGMASSEAPVNESIEDQIARIDALLNEKESPIDLRIYTMQIGCSVNNDVGGAEMEIETQIRGIPGVTTVKTVPDMRRPLTPQADYNVFEIKFEILGAKNRVEFRDNVVFPDLRKIAGINIIDWTPIHRTNVRGTIRTVRESSRINEWGLGGGAIGPTRNSPHGLMTTPRMCIEDIIKDWEEGVKAFDVPVNTNDMSYHVMMPLSELEPFMARIYRADKITFDGHYKQFIEKGPTLPVYLAIGRGGRVKVTGNEDLLWFAKRSGLEEVPVFISFQNQV